MVKLPDWQEIGLPRVSGGREIGGYDISPYARGQQARAKAVEESGRAISEGGRAVAGGLARQGEAISEAGSRIGKAEGELGSSIVQVYIEKNRWEYNQAHAQQLTNQIDLYSELQKDTDWQTMPDRYGKTIKKVNEDAASLIGDPRMRERFLIDTKSSVAQFGSNVLSHARKLEGNSNIAYVQAQGDKFINQGVNAPDEGTRTAVIDTHNSLVDGLAARGFVTPQHAFQMKKTWAERYATANVLSLIEKNPAEAVRQLEDVKSMHSIIPEDQRLNLLTRARSANIGEQYTVQRLVEDDVTSMLKTGEGVSGITTQRIMSAFGPRGAKAVIEWQEAKTDAKMIYSATNDMDLLTDSALEQRVSGYEPKPGGVGFQHQQKVYEEIKNRATKTLTQRYNDPALAVAKDPDVKAAAASVSDADPSSYQRLGDARIAAQTKLGLPDEVRTPLTKAEALHYAAPLQRMLPGQERETLTLVADRLQKRYGDEADRAFEHVLRAHKLDAETAKRAMPILKNLISGEAPGTKVTRTADQQTELAAADNAVTAQSGMTPGGVRERMTQPPVQVPQTSLRERYMNMGNGAAPELPREAATKPEKPVPPVPDIMALRKNPKLAPRFDQKYGPGSAKKILDAYPVGVPQ